MSVSAILLLLLAILTFVSFFAQAAFVNSIIQETINRLFGWGAIFIPFILSLTALLILKSRLRFVKPNILVGLVILSVSLMGLSHLFFDPEEALNEAQMGQGGGLAGYYLQGFLRAAIHPVGAFFVFIAGLILSLIITFNTSLNEVFERISQIATFGKTFFREKVWRAFKRKKEMELVLGGELDKEEKPEKEERKEPEFEIIPSPSEPVTKKAAPATLDAAIKQETVVNLPYSEQVWEYPPLDMLSDKPPMAADRGDIKENAQRIEKTLESFGVRARVAEVNMGPAVTQYALEAAQGTKIAKIINLQNDIALSLASPTGSVRVEAPIPGKSLIGIEVPNYSPSTVTLKSILASDLMKNAKSKLIVALGHDVAGQPVISDIGRMPHILIAGSTGSGKSVLLHSFIATLLFRCGPHEVKLIMVDPKRVELPQYNGIPHLLTPVIVESEKALPSLKWAIAEMERRYKLFENSKTRNINAYNELSGFQALPYILIMVDELADLMALAPVEVERSICRLAQMARATGIHLVLATQRPSVDVLTGLIKANIPCRIALNTVSQVDSRVIIDQTGAEKLLGRGDMLYVPPDASKPFRIQGVFVSDAETQRLIEFMRKSPIRPDYKEEVTEYVPPREAAEGPQDELFEEAVRTVCEYDRASASLLQRRLSIGYARAARLIDELEEREIIGSPDGSRPRDVLVHDAEQALGKIREEEEEKEGD